VLTALTTSTTNQQRYRLLDAWRALAALAVVAFHCTNTVVTPAMGWWAQVLLFGWAGVFVFFPISGYCIFAAISRDENATIGQFLKRRWRRIAPPYWASLAVAVAIAFAAAPFNGGRFGYLDIGLPRWLAVFSLTQVFVGSPSVINPVYWSLCYEEQFYLVVALALALSPERRMSWLLAVTVVSGLYRLAYWPSTLRVTGIFLDYWLEFSCGLAVFAWLQLPKYRWWAVTVLSIAGMAAVASRSVSLTVSAGVGVALIALAPFDAAFAASSVGSALIAMGLMSYSLYLIHVPIGGRVVNLLRRMDMPLLLPSLVGACASLAAGWLFYRTVERRFVNQSIERRTRAIDPVHVVVAPAV